jgi:Helix-turn-helix domain
MSGGTHLELEERERLAALKAEGLSLRWIARALGRAASTISRELRRNALPRGGYLPVHAEGCYLERRQRQAVLERDERLGRFVRERLLEGWTPEQIAGWLRRGEERGLRAVSTETIYAFVHRAGQKAEKLWKLLPRGRARRGRRRARQPRNGIAGRRSIHDRPEAKDRPSGRCRIGHRVAHQRLLQLLRIDQQALDRVATAGHGNPDEGGQPAIGEERQAVDLLLLDVDAVGARRDRALQALEGEHMAESDVHRRVPDHACCSA